VAIVGCVWGFRFLNHDGHNLGRGFLTIKGLLSAPADCDFNDEMIMFYNFKRDSVVTGMLSSHG